MAHTHRIRLIVLAIITVVTGLGPALPVDSVSDSSTSAVELHPETWRITIDGATPEQEAMVAWALARFEEAGLELPPMAIAFHPSTDGCQGFIGHYSRSAERLDVCNQGDSRTEPIHTVLHELAHAWSFTFLAADDRAQWSEHRGLAAWHDDSAAWWKQGREQAAEVIAWGLMSGAEPFINTWVIGENCEDLASSFRLLTGTDPLHAGNHSCRSTGMKTAISSGQVEWEVEGTAEQIELAEWARERFELAGLELPAVKVTFHDDEVGCDGNTGLYRPGEPAEVHLCSRSPLESKGTRLITLHELGHAWAESRLDAETRDRFLEVRGLVAWSDSALPTYEWGAEHAAETLSWGLMDESVRIVRIMNHSPVALAEAFEILTGSAPLLISEA